MRIRRSSSVRNRTSSRRAYRSRSSRSAAPQIISFVKGVTLFCIGSFLSMPMFAALLYDDSAGYLSVFELFSLLLFLVGSPTMFAGIIVMLNRNGNGVSSASSQAEMDIARMRHVAETDHMRGKR